MRTKSWALLMAASFTAHCAVAQTAIPAPAMQQDNRDATFARDFAAFAKEVETAIPTLTGLSVIVVRENGVIASANFGMADAENNVAASPETRWYIASTTKAFVGVALARLAARGEVNLDWTLAQLAPDIKFEPKLRANEVTLRHMLSHTHGMSGGAIPFRLANSGQHDPATLWRLLGTLESNGEAPLGTFSYNNLGYNVATILIERKLGKRWQDIVDKEVMRPLGMRATLTQGLERARKRAAFAAPYLGNAGEARERLYLVKYDDTMQSAGGMYSSTADMGKWLQAQLAAASGRRKDQLAQAIRQSHQSVAKMKARFGPFDKSDYGLGWYSADYGGSTLYHAFGSFSGSMAHSSFMPDANVAVAAMTNEGGPGALSPHIIAAFAYDYFLLGADQALIKGKERLSQAAKILVTERTQSIASRKSRAERTWTLTLPFNAYAGKFCSAAMGTVTLSATGSGLKLAIGRLNAEAEPFTEPDTMRIEAIPGNGMAGKFAIESGAVTGLELFDAKFQRCG